MKSNILAVLICVITAQNIYAKDITVTLYSKGCLSPNKYVYHDALSTTLTAIPQDCQQFVRWSDGNTDNPRTITLTSDTTFTAEFAPKQYTISTNATNGTITGDGKYDCNATATLTATPNKYYHFVKWSDGHTDNPRSVIVTQDSTFTAEFAKQVDSTQIIDVAVYGDCSKNGYSKDFTHIAAVNSSSGRSSCDYVQLWAGGPKWATFNVGATITDYATLTVGADATSFANYTDQAPYYNTANVGGLYAWNNPNLNGRMTTWTSSVSTGISDVATTLWGSNWKTPTKAQLDTLQNSAYGKTICIEYDGSTTQYVPGCTLKGYKVSGVGDFANYSIFLPKAGCYDYDKGTINNNEGGYYWSSTEFDSNTSNYLYLGVVGGRLITRTYRKIGCSVRAVLANSAAANVTITLKANTCSTSNVITCLVGQKLSIAATPNTGYHFVKWSDGNTDNPRSVIVTQDSTFTAIFVGTGYQETVKCTVINESPYGTVSFTGTVIKDSNISLQATAPECSKFVKWSDNDTSNPRNLIVTQDSTLTALFEKVQFNITLETEDESKGEVDGE